MQICYDYMNEIRSHPCYAMCINKYDWSITSVSLASTYLFEKHSTFFQNPQYPDIKQPLYVCVIKKPKLTTDPHNSLQQWSPASTAPTWRQWWCARASRCSSTWTWRESPRPPCSGSRSGRLRRRRFVSLFVLIDANFCGPQNGFVIAQLDFGIFCYPKKILQYLMSPFSRWH